MTAAYRRWAEERGVSGPWIRLRSELDGIASAGFLSRKTMYAFKMKWKGDVETGKETDEVDIAGFQTKRSDYPPILRLLQDEFLRRLLNGEDPNEIAFDVTPRIEAVAKGRCAPMDVAIPKGLQKAIGTYQNHSPWDSGAVWSNKHLTTVRFTQGSKPRLLYVKSVPKGMEPTDHICIESENDLVEGIEIDWPLMAEKIRAGFKGVITALGLNPKTFLTNQKPLEMFA